MGILFAFSYINVKTVMHKHYWDSKRKTDRKSNFIKRVWGEYSSPDMLY